MMLDYEYRGVKATTLSDVDDVVDRLISAEARLAAVVQALKGARAALADPGSVTGDEVEAVAIIDAALALAGSAEKEKP